MSAVLVSKINLMIEAGKANPGPKIASVLGPRGIPMPKFCKEFNDITSSAGNQYKVGDVVTARISIYNDKSYSFTISDSPVPYLLKKAAAVDKGSVNPGKDSVGKVKMSAIYEIAKRKMSDMNADTVDAAVKMVIGTASSMGIIVEKD
ncbi:50S ribosomal protein L11 [Ehrlichia ruminantium]|uniref:Large ribosomal subunit protein uL11 n=1 Tax=Ehrlichia ruminantium (strain Welgevonden) TaxID=254945 RepID=A0A0H3LZ80_EHRRW|nr:50S ribosomal protein L11 [Ehrlichia ruminantium]KYW94151.1 50S ribosomal protein L11 [Ehrlichia ruminantium]QLK50244.1 50S ribosomal protein L11 [Ehrlichia ruminantium]QLK51169.1 50S ribosomal protein L11 [Ehrlichia ruminantium]QLK52093.1 50S ribosomal protein L11 [Ehrlichia ruminantium]QLK53003.1 50S ribosomal protein L11 [Ehrlichia ruminantium]